MFDFERLPFIDNHCHPYLVEPEPDRPRYAGLDTFLGVEGDHGWAAEHRQAMVYQRWATRMLADYLGCEPTPEAVAQVRASETDELGYRRRLFADGAVEALATDMGFPQPPIGLDTFRQTTPVPVWPIFRIEPLIADLLGQQLAYDEFSVRFEAAVRGAISEDGYVGLKSIIAYRTGLDLDLAHRSTDAGRRGLEQALAEPDRLAASKPLRDHLLMRTLDLAIELDVPLQIHTGFGDVDILLSRCNPALLSATLKDDHFRQAKVILIHTYPFTAEASYLAAALPNVWCDLSLGIPFAPVAADRIVSLALELAPTNRLLAGSDACYGPEHTWLGAKLSKQALARVLTDLDERGLVTESEAHDMARDILAENARSLYRTA